MQRLKFGVVGLNFGGHLAKSLKDPPAADYIEFAAVCDIDRQRADAIGGKHGVKIYYDLDALLTDKDIPTIGLFTNPNGRARLLRKIIRAGKDVIATKPFELDPAEAADVLAEAKRLGRVIHSNSPTPLPVGPVAKILQWQKQYNLGRPIAARYDLWTRKHDKPDGSWLDDPEKCPAAPITRVGVYLINDLVRLLGPAEKVHVLASRLFTGKPTPDNAQLGIQYQSGAIANVFVSFCIDDGAGFHNQLIVNFERGTIYYDLGCMPKEPKANLMLVGKDAAGKAVNDQAFVAESSSGYQWDLFHRAVRGERLTGEITAEQIVEGVKVLAAMARSAKSGRVEAV